MLMPRWRDAWILLVVAVLIASTIVTAALAAVLTQLLFPNGFLIDLPAPRPPVVVDAPPAVTPVPPTVETPPPVQPPPTAPRTASWSVGWRASVSCSISLGDDIEGGGGAESRP